MEPIWKFRIPQESEVNQDPIEGEFFTTQDVGDMADALVRESVQNSLDAKLPSSPGMDDKGIVTVRFNFSNRTPEDAIMLRNHKFFNGLYDHIISLDNGLNLEEIPSLSNPVYYLTIEDFQTVGLDGDVNENDDPKTQSPLGHNFYWFWRNVGRSGKKGNERGKWGLGKTVFPASSSINTFFGLTSRHDDAQINLMGLSVLKTHHLRNELNIKRYPYGYFGNFENEDEFFSTPIIDGILIHDFSSIFKLQRSMRTSSGLSIVIPFPREEITSKAIIRSVLRQYFFPILNSSLIIEVIDGTTNISYSITQDSIFEFAEKMNFLSEFEINPKALTKLLMLCKWGLELEETSFIKLIAPALNHSVMWKKEWYLNPDIEKQIKNKIIGFEDGKRVAFKVPVKIQAKEQEPMLCWFKVYIEKDETMPESDSYFIRDGITITGIKKPKSKYIRAIVVIDDENLVRFLGNAENPAHTEWQKGSSHFIGKYVDGDKTISFIEKSIDNLCSLFIKPAEGIDQEILSDLFFIEMEDNDIVDEPDDDNGEDDVFPPEPNNVTKRHLPFIISKIPGGFKCTKNQNAFDFNGKIEITTAYMVAKGSPIKKYSPFDFDMGLAPITLVHNGIESLKVDKNKISFAVCAEDDFECQVKGFDILRDIFIKADYYDQEI